MKIGILTFQSQTSYGGVLQAVALRDILLKEGHDVCVFDHIMYRGTNGLSPILPPREFIGTLKYVFRVLFCMGEVGESIRRIRTAAFLKRKLNLTKYRFFSWDEAPTNLGVDLIVVGSDQVWRCNDNLDVRPYLLVDAPKVPAISYAASIGMHGIPPALITLYKDGLSKFSAISTREEEAANIVRSLGFEATHVVDPTLLDAELFTSTCANIKEDKQLLVLYILHQPIESFYRSVCKCCKAHNLHAIILRGGAYRELPKTSIRDFLYSLAFPIIPLLNPRVKVRARLPPEEFYRTMASANKIITDSFHGTMFATIFRKNLRILSPKNAFLEGMFSRMGEFVKECISGNTIAETIPAAMRSFESDGPIRYNDAVIEDNRSKSLQWLKTAIAYAYASH